MPAATFTREGDLGIITLSAPPLNLVSYETATDLLAAAREAAYADGLRAVYVHAEGDAFSAGADVNMFRDRTAESGRELIEEILPGLQAFEALPIPTVAAVQGLCLAGGFELALACDLIWAGDDAQFGLIEAVIGAMPFGGGTQRLAARAGVARAAEAVFTARIYPAQTMLEWGVLNRIVPAADLHPKTRAFAEQLANAPTLALVGAKQMLRLWKEEGMRAADEDLAEVGGRVMASEDIQGGLRSLLEHGPGHATFEGR